MPDITEFSVVNITRSDGQDTGPGYWPTPADTAAKNAKQAPQDKMPRLKPQMIRLAEDDPRYQEWRVKLGLLLKQELSPTEGLPWLINFPRGYWLYEKSKHLWVSGYPVKAKLFKSPQEFAVHLLWLLSNSEDRMDCSADERPASLEDAQDHAHPAAQPNSISRTYGKLDRHQEGNAGTTANTAIQEGNSGACACDPSSYSCGSCTSASAFAASGPALGPALGPASAASSDSPGSPGPYSTDGTTISFSTTSCTIPNSGTSSPHSSSPGFSSSASSSSGSSSGFSTSSSTSSSFSSSVGSSSGSRTSFSASSGSGSGSSYDSGSGSSSSYDSGSCLCPGPSYGCSFSTRTASPKGLSAAGILNPNNGKPEYLQILPLSHTLFGQKAIQQVESTARPFLAFSVPNVNIPDLQNKAYDEVPWDTFLRNLPIDETDKRREVILLDSSKMAAQKVGQSYSLFSRISGTASGKKVDYHGIFLGAERIELGDAIRIRINPEQGLPPAASDLADALIGLREICTAVDIPGAVFLKGDIYQILSGDTQPVAGVPVPEEKLPRPLREEHAFRSKFVPKERWRYALLKQNAVIREQDIKGRFYPTHRLLPLLDGQSKVMSDVQQGIVRDPQQRLNQRVDTFKTGYIGLKRNRHETIGPALPPGTSIQFGPEVEEDVAV
ncbi:hypothetical protein C8035_v008894 [Colletotrichum spinosum]|uniref:Uncharacterized protein n=1 Tax=Colletotrichum spinosum TaxID=1347390 RepID=A0A4R8QGV7_9PEZI|nr:hypothetical protein C8035_v008894 [Colletotrichum spinosum]